MEPNHQDNNTVNNNDNQNHLTQTHQQQQPVQEQQQEITPETIQQFNNICLQATQLMNDYKNQSIALKQEIAGMVSIYQKNTSGTDAVPVQKIISITQQYQQGMKQANKQYTHLAQELKKQQQQRDNIMFQIKDCFDKLQRMETKIKAKKLKQQQQKNKLNQQQHQQKLNLTGQKEDENKVQTNKTTVTEQKKQEPQN